MAGEHGNRNGDGPDSGDGDGGDAGGDGAPGAEAKEGDFVHSAATGAERGIGNGTIPGANPSELDLMSQALVAVRLSMVAAIAQQDTIIARIVRMVEEGASFATGDTEGSSGGIGRDSSPSVVPVAKEKATVVHTFGGGKHGRKTG